MCCCKCKCTTDKKMSQRDAVYKAVGMLNLTGSSKRPDAEQQDAIRGIVYSLFHANKVKLPASRNRWEEELFYEQLWSYTGGLVNNWIIKDIRYNWHN